MIKNKYKMKALSALMIIGLSAAPIQASLRIAATVPNMGMLAREIGGDKVTVRVMSPPNRDAHYLEARPSMMADLRRADMVVAVGAELEVGWLPAAIRGANNPRVQTGRSGYFEGAAHIELIETGIAADRSRGDVHPAGNPHFDLSPEHMAEVGLALARRMGQLDPDNAQYYMSNAESFALKVEERMPLIRERASASKGAVTYHGDANYLLRALGVPLLGHIEPLPGIPPTASHLRELVRDLRDKEGVITHTEFQPSRGADFLSRELGWPVYMLPVQVAVDADAEAFFEMIGAWADVLSGN